MGQGEAASWSGVKGVVRGKTEVGKVGRKGEKRKEKRWDHG